MASLHLGVLLVNSLEGREMEAITISSKKGICNTREKKFQKAILFPNKT